MPNQLDGFEIIQWGRENSAARGTPVAATSKAVFEMWEFEPTDSLYRPRFKTGVVLENPGLESVMTRGTRWRCRVPLTFEQAMHWLELMIQGTVTPTGAGPYTYTYTRAATTQPALASFTVQRRESDGTTNTDNGFAYLMAEKIKLSAAPQQMVMLEAEGFARRIQAGTGGYAFTAALSLPTVEQVPHGSVALYLDDTWAGRGTTQVSNQLVSWELEVRTGAEPFFTSDGRTDLDYPTHVVNPEESGFRFKSTILVPGSGSQMATEKTKAEAAALRAIELRATGTSNRSLKLQMLAKHEKASVFKVGSTRGQTTVDLEMVGSTDQTNYMAAVLINNVAAFA